MANSAKALCLVCLTMFVGAQSTCVSTPMSVPTTACPAGKYKQGIFLTDDSLTFDRNKRIMGERFNIDTWPATDACRSPTHRVGVANNDVAIYMYKTGNDDVGCYYFHLADVVGAQSKTTVDRTHSTCSEWHLLPDSASDGCAPCPTGMSCVDSTFQICGAGKFSTGGSDTCADCPAGKWIADAGTDARLHESVDNCVATAPVPSPSPRPNLRPNAGQQLMQRLFNFFRQLREWLNRFLSRIR
jgi:hypothetical protein